MKNTVFPTFKTERLILREITEADAPTFQENFATYEVINELNDTIPWPYPKNGAIEYLRAKIFPNQGKELWMWGITFKTDPHEIIGSIILLKNGDPGNRGFWLAKKYWGQGIMIEAATPIMNYAFNILGFEKMILTNAVGNLRSRRIKEKNGAKLLRVAPGKFVNPNYNQREIWELTKEEWFKRQSC